MQSPPDIEAVVGVWGILCPLKQRPLKLDGDLGDGVGRQLNQHLQEVWLQPVLGRLVVDVTCRQARVKGHPYLFPDVRLSVPLLHLWRPWDLDLGAQKVGKPGSLREGSKVSERGKDVSRAAVPGLFKRGYRGHNRPLTNLHLRCWAADIRCLT